MKTKASQQNRFLRIISIPIRALGKARDFYVKSMTDYADRVNYSKVVGASQVSGIPRSFSVNSVRSYDNEDFQELVRAASARSMGNRIDLDLYSIKQQQMKIIGNGLRAMPPRSSSVAMGRIDEENPCCSFDEEIVGNINVTNNLKKELKYPRSKSHAVVTRRTPF